MPRRITQRRTIVLKVEVDDEAAYAAVIAQVKKIDGVTSTVWTGPTQALHAALESLGVNISWSHSSASRAARAKA